MNKLGQKLPPLKKSTLNEKSQKEEYEIKRKINEADQYWNDWTFQIFWDKRERVNPRSRDERKYILCVF